MNSLHVFVTEDTRQILEPKLSEKEFEDLCQKKAIGNEAVGHTDGPSLSACVEPMDLTQHGFQTCSRGSHLTSWAQMEE